MRLLSPFFVDDDFNYIYFNGQKIPFLSSVDPLCLAQRLQTEELSNPIKMILYMGEHEEVIDSLCQDLGSLETLDIDYHEQEKYPYLNPYQTNKATTLVEQIGDEFVAFGNDKNDIAMFNAPLYRVQVGELHYLRDNCDEQVPADSSAIANKILELFEVYQNVKN